MTTLLNLLWKLSIITNMLWLTKILTTLLIPRWSILYNKYLECDAKWHFNRRLLTLTFDLSVVGSISPRLLGSVYITILNHPGCLMLGHYLSVIIVAEYEGDHRTLSRHFNITPTTTPEQFIRHFLHLTDIHGYGESKTVLTSAQFLVVKIVSSKQTTGPIKTNL